MDYKEQASYLKRRSRRQFEDADENAMYQAAQSIMELLDRAEAAEARCKRLDEARERANEAAHKWEGRCKILEPRLETAEKMVKEYQDVIVPGYRERAEKAEGCINAIEDDLDRGSDNDWARGHIAEYRGTKEE